LGTTTRFLTIFFIFLTPPLVTVDVDAAPLTGGRLVDVDAAAPPRVVSLLILLLLCTDDEVESADEGENDKFQGSRGGRKMPRPLNGDEEDCAALTTLPVIETTANR
jgi:hypothetical protein